MATRTGDFETGALSAASILRQPEELDIELLQFLGEVDSLGLVLKAPLVFMVPYLPALAALANKTYRGKLAAVYTAEAQGAWQKVLWLHERPYRMRAFQRVQDRMSDCEYWQALADFWLDTESLYEDQDEWVKALTVTRAGRSQWLMDERERAVLASLEEEVTVYRGFHRPGRHLAPSWTLNLARAEWFARRPIDRSTGSYVASVTVPKASLIAYFGGRNEQEAVLDPGQLPEPQITEVEAVANTAGPCTSSKVTVSRDGASGASSSGLVGSIQVNVDRDPSGTPTLPVPRAVAGRNHGGRAGIQAIIQRPGAASDSLILPSLASTRMRASTRLSGSLNELARSAGL